VDLDFTYWSVRGFSEVGWDSVHIIAAFYPQQWQCLSCLQSCNKDRSTTIPSTSEPEPMIPCKTRRVQVQPDVSVLLVDGEVTEPRSQLNFLIPSICLNCVRSRPSCVHQAHRSLNPSCCMEFCCHCANLIQTSRRESDRRHSALPGSLLYYLLLRRFYGRPCFVLFWSAHTSSSAALRLSGLGVSLPPPLRALGSALVVKCGLEGCALGRGGGVCHQSHFHSWLEFATPTMQAAISSHFSFLSAERRRRIAIGLSKSFSDFWDSQISPLAQNLELYTKMILSDLREAGPDR